MLIRLFAAFDIVPLIELYLLLQLAGATSVLTTIMIVVVTGIIGSYLARREGLMAWLRFRTALAEGRMPSREIQDGLMIVFAAALLLTPGLLTDAVGFVLLIPPTRALVRKFVLSRYISGMHVQVHTSGPSASQPNASQVDSFQQGRQRDGTYTIDAKAVKRDPST